MLLSVLAGGLSFAVWLYQDKPEKQAVIQGPLQARLPAEPQPYEVGPRYSGASPRRPTSGTLTPSDRAAQPGASRQTVQVPGDPGLAGRQRAPKTIARPAN